MKERIKKIRKALDLTQQEFADRLGISRGNIATYETREGGPSNSVIALICREFSVNETWLRTGKGEMFSPTAETEIDALAKKYHLSDIGRALIGAYIQLSEADRASVDRYVRLLATSSGLSSLTALEPESPDKKPVTQKELNWRGQEIDMAAIDKQVELYRQQLLSEQEREKQAPFANGSGAG